MPLTRSLSTRMIVMSVAALFCVSPAVGEASVTPEERLAGQLVRTALRMLQQDPLPLDAIEGSFAIMREAADLTPNDPDVWRLVVQIAQLVEDDAARHAALRRLVSLDPGDEVSLLKWTTTRLQKAQTAEALAASLQGLLEPDNREQLGPAIASRLALDLALLERRRGESERFADRLAQAVALDPTNQEAAAVAVGYFQAHVDDPVAEAELLVHLLLANPTDVDAQVLLASHLLWHAAYRGADRFYTLALRSHAPLGARPADGLVADAAIAQIGTGDLEGALRRLNDHQRQADILLQQRLFHERPELTPMERAQRTATLTPAFATVRAAILNRLGREVETAADVVTTSYLQEVEANRASENENRERTEALLRLEQAWVLLWLGGRIEDAREAIDAARTIAELSEAAEARFAGWEALRLRELDRAVSLLEVHAESDAPSRLGLALAQIERGERREGARNLLAVARAQPGTLIGVWAADRLAELLGSRPAMTPQAGALDSLAANVPPIIDRIAQDPSSAVSIRLVPQQMRLGAYAPLMVNIEITNSSSIPLAIDPAGPIRPEVVIYGNVQAAQTPFATFLPIVIGIDRRIRLMPRERLIVPVDLRRTSVGDYLNRYPLPGAMVRLRAMLNFRATPTGALVPSLLGSETSPQSIRIDGARITPAWAEEMLRVMSSPAETVNLPQLALLSHVAARELRPEAPAAERQIIRDLREAFAASFAALDAPSQAWLMAVMPKTATMREAIEPALRIDERIVRLAHVLFMTADMGDPILAEALRSDDENLLRLAQFVRRALDEEETDVLGTGWLDMQWDDPPAESPQ